MFCVAEDVTPSPVATKFDMVEHDPEPMYILQLQTPTISSELLYPETTLLRFCKALFNTDALSTSPLRKDTETASYAQMPTGTTASEKMMPRKAYLIF